FTPLTEKLGEESVFHMVRRIVGEQTQAIQRHGGVLQDFAGDGLMAVFGAPIALEDAPLRACRAAADIQARIDHLRTEIEAQYGVAPKLRTGIHTGPAVVGKIGEDKALAYSALGDAVNVAARIQAAADPGTTFLSKPTLELVEGFVEFTAVGERELK